MPGTDAVLKQRAKPLGQDVYVELPPAAELEQALCKKHPEPAPEAVAS